MATTKMFLVDLRCDEADCTGDRCRYEVCPCRCHRSDAHGASVKRTADLYGIAPFDEDQLEEDADA